MHRFFQRALLALLAVSMVAPASAQSDIIARGLAANARTAAQRGQAFFSIYNRFVTKAEAARKSNPRTAGLYANPPVISFSTTAPSGSFATSTPTSAGGAGNGVLSGSNYVPYVTITGSRNSSVSGVALQPYGVQRNITVDGNYFQQLHKAIWETDAPIFYVALKESQLTAFRLLIDGQYVDGGMGGMTGTVLGAANTTYYMKLDFSAAGTPRQMRRYALEMQGASATNGGSRGFQLVGPFFLTPADSISAPQDLGLKVTFEGDSYTFGPVPSQVTTSMLGDGFAPIAMDNLGIENWWNQGIGGTGWLMPNSGTNPNILDRITDVTGFPPDLLIIDMGINEELGAGTTSVSGGILINTTNTQARVTAYLTQVRAALPNLPIIVLGPFKTPAISTATAQSYETAIFAGVAAMNDPLIATVANNGTTAPMQTGTGYTGATNGTGNSDQYISTDQTHPTLAGHQFLGKRAAQMIRQGMEKLRTQVIAAYGIPTS